MSRRAFSKVIAETIFDLASEESVGNLQKIAGHTELSPWVQKITLAFLVGHSPANDSGVDDASQRERSLNAKVERELFQKATNSVENLSPLSHLSTVIDPDSGTGKIISAQQAAFRRFPNVEQFVYTCDDGLLPHRHRRLLNPWSHLHININLPKQSDIAVYAGYWGLKMSLEALAGGHIQPRLLVLSIELDAPYDFITYASSQAYNFVCKNVQTLPLCQEQSTPQPKSLILQSVTQYFQL